MHFRQTYIQRTNDLRIEQTYDGFRIQRKSIITKVSWFGLRVEVREQWYNEKTANDSGRELIFGVRPYSVLSDAQAEMQRIKEFPKYYYK